MTLNIFTKQLHCLIFASLALALSGCETTEEITARQDQFNGSSLAQVIATIGEPTQRDKSKATWTYKNSYINRVPIQHYMNGKWITTGYRNETVQVNCTFVATLNSGRVIKSDYEGNRCKRFAPKL